MAYWHEVYVLALTKNRRNVPTLYMLKIQQYGVVRNSILSPDGSTKAGTCWSICWETNHVWSRRNVFWQEVSTVFRFFGLSFFFSRLDILQI